MKNFIIYNCTCYCYCVIAKIFYGVTCNVCLAKFLLNCNIFRKEIKKYLCINEELCDETMDGSDIVQEELVEVVSEDFENLEYLTEDFIIEEVIEEKYCDDGEEIPSFSIAPESLINNKKLSVPIQKGSMATQTGCTQTSAMPPQIQFEIKSSMKKYSKGVQTGSSRGAQTCGLIEMAMSSKIFTLNCFYCEENFPICNWSKFVTHLAENHDYLKHQQDANTIIIENTEYAYREKVLSTLRVCGKQQPTIDAICNENALMDNIKISNGKNESSTSMIVDNNKHDYLKHYQDSVAIINKNIGNEKKISNLLGRDAKKENCEILTLDFETNQQSAQTLFLDANKQHFQTLIIDTKNQSCETLILDDSKLHCETDESHEIFNIQSNYQKVYVELKAPADEVDGNNDAIVEETDDPESVHKTQFLLPADSAMGYETNSPEMFQTDFEDEGAKIRDGSKMIHFGKTQPSIIWDFLELIRGYPVLWYVRYGRMLTYDTALADVTKRINDKWGLDTTEVHMRSSLNQIKEWFRAVVKRKEKQENYKNRFSDYFEKCAEFLPKSELIPCDICKCYSFAESDLKRHKFGDPPYKCSQCDRRFVDKSNFCSYEAYHVKGPHLKKFHCEKCNKDFRWQSTFNEHRCMRDPNDRRFACEICDKRFLTSSVRNSHQLVVHGEPRFKCELCPKAYHRHWIFEEHMKVHRDQRDYVCEECGRTFVRQKTYMEHKKSVHEGRARCHICNILYTTQSVLLKHQRTYHMVLEGTVEELSRKKKGGGKVKHLYVIDEVTKQKRIVCRACGKMYKGLDGLRCHEIKEHDYKPKKKLKKDSF